MSNHSPGPWAAYKHRSHQEIQASDGSHVAEVFGAWDMDCRTNARLIAAAPEMYELLRDWAENAPWGGVVGTAQNRIAQVRALLARIDGED